MHRYQPRIHLVKWREGMMANGAFVSDLDSEYFRTFIFPETVFTAVTAYQNQLVRKKGPLRAFQYQILGSTILSLLFPIHESSQATKYLSMLNMLKFSYFILNFFPYYFTFYSS